MTQIVPTVPVTVPVTAPEPDLTPALVGGLARELAIGLRELEDILVAYNLSRTTYDKLQGNEFFTKAVDLARIEWNSAGNTIVRTQLEVAAAFELGFPKAYAIALDPKTPFNHSVDFFKLMADVGGIKKQPNQGQAGERFQITINLGADTTLEFEGSRTPLNGDPALAALPIPQLEPEERV